MAEERDARPEHLKRKLAALIALIGADFATRPRSVAEIAADARPRMDAALAALIGWIAAEWGVPERSLNLADITPSLYAAVRNYLDEHRDLSGEEARRYAELVASSELRRIESGLVQQAVRQRDATQVERRLGYSRTGPCARCKSLAGVHPANFPNLYWEHPDGRCSWHPVPEGGGVSVFARYVSDALDALADNRRWERLAAFAAEHHGNESALLAYWREHMGQGQGTPGDYDNCVSVLSKHPKITDAHALCQWLHIRSTGHPAGHAPGEQEAKHAKRSQRSVGFEHPAKGPHHCSECVHFQKPNACALVAGPIDAGDWCRLFKARVVAMANWDSDEKRQNAPAETFCGPHRSFPIDDCEDVTHARQLLHHAANQGAVGSCVEGKAKKLGCPPPQSKNASEAIVDKGVAVFAAAVDSAKITAPDGMRVRSGKLFDLETHVDMHGIPFGLTREDMALNEMNFQPVPISLGHPEARSPLDGRLGELRAIHFAADGTLSGDVALPAWIDDELGPGPVNVSTEWNIATKRLAGLSLVTEGGVTDAALFAAFAKSATPEERGTAEHAAAGMSAPHTIPVDHWHFHDGGTQSHGGAHVHAPGVSSHEGGIHNHGPYATAGDIMSGGGTKGWNFHPVPEPRAVGYGRKPMNLGEKIKSWFAGGMQGDLEVEDEIKAAFAAAPPDPRIAAMEQELAVERAKRIEAEAVAFAEKEIDAHRSMPADKERLIAKYTQAMKDDMALGVVKFASGTKSRVQMLVEDEAERTPHLLSQDMLPNDADGAAAAAAFANLMKTKGRLSFSGQKQNDDLAERDPDAFRSTDRYEKLARMVGMENGNGHQN